MTSPAPYSPAQQRILDVLGRSADADADNLPPDSGAVADLRAHLESRLTEVASRLPDGESIFVGKRQLATFEACPGSWRAEEAGTFRWTVPALRGTVAHKAIELSVNWPGEAEPACMVDEAMAALVRSDRSAGPFLQGLGPVDVAELRSLAVAYVTSFEETFPALRAAWRPVVEGGIRVEAAGGRVVLFGRPDLALGRATAGGKVLLDLKTGRRAEHHTDDLRFYALLDACKVGLPPRRTATVYLESATAEAEAVTVETLASAADRLVDLVADMVEVRTGRRQPTLRTGPTCAWCPASSTCVAARSESGEVEEPVASPTPVTIRWAA